MKLEELQIRAKYSPLPPSASEHLKNPDAAVCFQRHITGPVRVAGKLAPSCTRSQEAGRWRSFRWLKVLSVVLPAGPGRLAW